MIKKVYILLNQILKEDQHTLTYGGLTTYALALSRMFVMKGFEVWIYQESNKPFESNYEGIKVVSVQRSRKRKILKKYLKKVAIGKQDELVIFLSDYLVFRNQYANSLMIQHGIAWDIQDQQPGSHAVNILHTFVSAFGALRKYWRFMLCKEIVCVDYNFLNWYRTQFSCRNNNIHVIPNFSMIPDENTEKNIINGNVSLIFARNLFQYRGTRIFTNAIEEILVKFPNIRVTIAGQGTDEKWMKERLGGYSQITFTYYTPDNSLKIHQYHDIAIVPTIGSEGTSLSLLEAMAAGCAVISTNVGGMTNIILDGYNGLMINPDVSSLFEAIARLIENPDLRNRLAQKGRETVKDAFSYEKWTNSWMNVISNIN